MTVHLKDISARHLASKDSFKDDPMGINVVAYIFSQAAVAGNLWAFAFIADGRW